MSRAGPGFPNCRWASGRTQEHPAPLGPDRRQGADGLVGSPEPLVARSPLRRRARADDATPACGRRDSFEIDFDFVDHRFVVPTSGGASSPSSSSTGSRWRRSTRSCTRRSPGRRRRSDPRDALRRADDDAVPGRPGARLVRRGCGRALLADPGLDRRRLRGVRRLVLRQDQPGPPLLAFLRSRLHALRRPPRTGESRRRPVTREAYSHEVVSFGFWAGDQDVREPTYYSYTAPEPEGLRSGRCGRRAFWADRGPVRSLSSAMRQFARRRSEGDAARVPRERVRGRSRCGRLDVATWARRGARAHRS